MLQNKKCLYICIVNNKQRGRDTRTELAVKMKNTTQSTQRIKAVITTPSGSIFDYEFDAYPDMSYANALIAKYGNRSKLVTDYAHTLNTTYQVI